ncbi:MAG: hypothetical protein ACOCQR_00060 [bacterium]
MNKQDIERELGMAITTEDFEGICNMKISKINLKVMEEIIKKYGSLSRLRFKIIQSWKHEKLLPFGEKAFYQQKKEKEKDENILDSEKFQNKIIASDIVFIQVIHGNYLILKSSENNQNKYVNYSIVQRFLKSDYKVLVLSLSGALLAANYLDGEKQPEIENQKFPSFEIAEKEEQNKRECKKQKKGA